MPGQGFSRVRIKTDQDSRIRFADLQGKFFQGGSQKEQLKITIVNLPFPWDFVCMQHALFALRGVMVLLFFKPLTVTRCFVKVVGTIVVSVCWPSSSTLLSHWLDSGNCKWNSPLSPTGNIVCVLARTPNINYKLSNIMVGENVIIILSILYAACSNCSATPWQQMMILYGSPLISKKECV